MENGVYPVVVVYLTPEDRERLTRAFVNWPNVPTNILTHKLPHEGQVQFILVTPEQSGNIEGTMVDQGIVEQINAPDDEDSREDER